MNGVQEKLKSSNGVQSSHRVVDIKTYQQMIANIIFQIQNEKSLRMAYFYISNLNK